MGANAWTSLKCTLRLRQCTPSVSTYSTFSFSARMRLWSIICGFCCPPAPIDLLRVHVARLREMSPLWELVQEGVDLSTIQWTQDAAHDHSHAHRGVDATSMGMRMVV